MQNLTCSSSELAQVLGITDRRVRQLAEDGAFRRIGRGRYDLPDAVQAFVAMAESRSQPAELLKERVRLIKAQARRVELDNSGREGTRAELDAGDVIVSAAVAHLFLRLRPVASWLHADLITRNLPGDLPRVIAGTVQGWIVGARAEIEAELRTATERARRRGHPIRDYEDLLKLLGREIEDVEADGEVVTDAR